MTERKTNGAMMLVTKIVATLFVAMAVGVGAANWSATQQNECDIAKLTSRVAAIDVMLSNIQNDQTMMRVDMKEMKVLLQELVISVHDLQRSVEP